MKHVHEIAQEVFVRSPFNYDMAAASYASGLSCPEATRAQQQFIEECDINTIVRRFGLTGELPRDVKMPVEGDFTEVTDFQSAMNLILASQAAFMQMPAEVRARFENDPHRFVAFCSDPANLEEARRLGIARPLPTPREPLEVVVRDDLTRSGAKDGPKEKPPKAEAQ